MQANLRLDQALANSLRSPFADTGKSPFFTRTGPIPTAERDDILPARDLPAGGDERQWAAAAAIAVPPARRS